VTVVAWIFIVLTGFTTFISLLQNAMLAFMPQDLFNQALRDSTFTHAMPSGTRFMFAHLRLFVFLVLIVGAATLISSIGLLRRRNWARLLFIALLGLGIVYSIAALFLQQSMMSSFNALLPTDSALGRTGQDFRHMMGAMRVVMFVFAIGFAGLFGWIIAKLLSPPIRKEFSSSNRAA